MAELELQALKFNDGLEHIGVVMAIGQLGAGFGIDDAVTVCCSELHQQRLAAQVVARVVGLALKAHGHFGRAFASNKQQQIVGATVFNIGTGSQT